MSARVSHGMRRQPNDPACECSRCNAPATMTEWSPLPNGSTAFYSYCSRCWHEPGPNAPSPAVRTDVNAPSVYADCVAAALTIDHHESDLYILDSPAARAVLARHTARFEPFAGTDGRTWLDVPFAFDPFWQAAAAR